MEDGGLTSPHRKREFSPCRGGARVGVGAARIPTDRMIIFRPTSVPRLMACSFRADSWQQSTAVRHRVGAGGRGCGRPCRFARGQPAAPVAASTCGRCCGWSTTPPARTSLCVAPAQGSASTTARRRPATPWAADAPAAGSTAATATATAMAAPSVASVARADGAPHRAHTVGVTTGQPGRRAAPASTVASLAARPGGQRVATGASAPARPACDRSHTVAGDQWPPGSSPSGHRGRGRRPPRAARVPPTVTTAGAPSPPRRARPSRAAHPVGRGSAASAATKSICADVASAAASRSSPSTKRHGRRNQSTPERDPPAPPRG